MRKWHKQVCGLLIVWTIVMPASAQEFWMQVPTFFISTRDTINVTLASGENFIGKSLPLTAEQWDTLKQYIETSFHSLKASVNNGSTWKIFIPQDGTHLLIAQSKNILVEYDGDVFRAKLKNYGLEEVYVTPSPSASIGKLEKVFLLHTTKLLIQSGVNKNDTYKKILNAPLDIIPEKNPYQLKRGDMVRFKILWQGKPWFGARVKVWNRKDNRTTLQNIYTEQNGTFEVPISNEGPWMISVEQVVPLMNNAMAQWQHYSSSLVFGVK